MNLRVAWVLLGLLVPWLVAMTNPLTGDIWWNLKVGELLAGGLDLLAQDPLTFPPHPEGYLNGQWLGELWYYGVYRLAGLHGVAAVNGVQVTAAFALVLHLAWRRCGDVRVAALCTLLGAIVAATNFSARAQTLALLMFALTLWLVWAPPPPGIVEGGEAGAPRPDVSNRERRGAKAEAAPAIPLSLTLPHKGGEDWVRLTGLMVVSVLWVNVHGSFLLGPLVTLMALVGHRQRWFLLALAAQVLGSLANPYGLGILTYVAGVITNPVVRGSVTEWQPPGLDLSGGVFFGEVIFLAGLLAWRRMRGAGGGACPTYLGDLLLLGGFAVLGVLAVRNLAWWGVAAPAVLAGLLAAALPRPTRRGTSPRATRLPGWVIVASLGTFMGFCVPWVKGANPLLPAERRAIAAIDEPGGAADFLAAAGSSGRLFAFQPWGGLLEWRLGPASQLMVDGRIELRPEKLWRDYAAISAGDGTSEDLLGRYDIHTAVVSRGNQPTLVERMAGSAVWEERYGDAISVVYGRR